MSKNKKQYLYTDGSSLGNPGPGGRAAIYITYDGTERIAQGYVPHATNNQMELQGVIGGLDIVDVESEFTIVTDSEYVYKGITSYIYNRQRNNRRNAQKRPIKNKELRQALWERLCAYKHISWQHTYAHADDIINNRVDTIARAAAQKNITK